MKLKHRLPLIAELPHLNLTPDELIQTVDLVKSLEDEFVNVVEANKKLCGIHHVLASDAYANFFQIALTDSRLNTDPATVEDCSIEHTRLNSSGMVSNMKVKLQEVSSDNSVYNEKLYTEKTSVYESNKYLLDGIFSRFRGKPTRARFVKLNSGTSVAPHIDYDPGYAVRVIIPIISTEDCLNIFWRKGIPEVYHLKPGVAYFLNTGYRHAVVNLSKSDRYTILVSIDGIDDINNLIL